MGLSKHRVLSREEEVELSRSKKKVKDVHHAEFHDGSSDGDHSQGHQNAWGSSRASFKDKLVGEIPGAFAKAFNFAELMDDEAESDDEVSDLREGLAAVKLSRETKRQIRGPWAQSLIVKLYGRSVSFNFLQSKLNLLWKPTGRLDCVDLGHDFYSVRFALKEDLESVLEKGPWFIGGQFLSIRPWEPFFKPAEANVSSIAVWIRLQELPLEFYETEVLKQIGEAIGKVLRIDAYTALEARGKYARLCLQVDINKPLINTVLIGRFEQQVVYEGIHKLCFACGRIGHKKDVCSHIVRSSNSPAKGVDDEIEDPAKSRSLHAMDSTAHGSDTSGGSGEAASNALYGPWTVVTRKKPGQRLARNVANMEGPMGPAKEVMSHSLGKGPSSKLENLGWAEEPFSPIVAGVGPSKKTFQDGPNCMGVSMGGSELNIQFSPSVRGKKGLARTRALLSHTKPAAVNCNRPSSHHDQSWSWQSVNGDKEKSAASFQFTASTQPDEVVADPFDDAGKKKGEVSSSHSPTVGDGVDHPDAGPLRGESGGNLDSEKGVGSASIFVAKERAEKGNGGAVGMDFEDGGGFDASVC